MNGTQFFLVSVLVLILQGDVLGAFDPVAVKAKIDALKTQMTVVTQARTAASTAKTSLDTTLSPYQQYSSTSTVVANALTLSAGFATIDAPYQSLTTYSGTTFDPAYQAYFTFYAKSLATAITTALTALKASATTINSLVTSRTTAQNYFNEVVSGVTKPAFLGT